MNLIDILISQLQLTEGRTGVKTIEEANKKTSTLGTRGRRKAVDWGVDILLNVPAW